jgi:hypothetical protein
MIQRKRLFAILFTAGFLLLLPFIAMQFTDEVSWSGFDFAVAAALLFGTGLLCEFILRRFRSRIHRLLLCGALLVILLLIWVELALGIFGTVFSGS